MKPTLRPYQTRAVSEILAYLQRGERGVVLDSPVGSGKTSMGIDITRILSGAGLKVGWFTHRQELRFQAIERAAVFDIPVAEIAPGHDLRPDIPVHVASIDTVTARLPSLTHWLRDLDVAVFDEVHHGASASWRRIMNTMPQAQLLGLSATPYRLDGKGLGDAGHFTAIVKTLGVRELTEQGYLSPGIVYAPDTNLDMSNVGRRGGDFKLDQMAAAVAKSDISVVGRRWYARHAPGQPAIVFCPTVELAESSAEAYRAAGWNAVSVDGSMSDRQRAKAIYGLEDGTVQILTSCALISEGLDIPAVSVAILERPTESTGLFQQQIGRCLRPHVDKTHATIIDLVRNTRTHGMYDTPRKWDLIGGVKKLEKDVAGTWRCKKCYRVYEMPAGGRTMQCGCGHTQLLPGMAPAKAVNHGPINGISAERLSEMKLSDAVRHCYSLGDYERLGKIRQYKPGWALMAWEHSNKARRSISRMKGQLRYVVE